MTRTSQLATALVAAMLSTLLFAGIANADGSVNCSSDGSFYTVVGESNLGPVADNVSASIDVQSLNRCNGTDPNGKNGVFVYVQLLATYEADAPGVQFAYDNPANPSYYGDYLRFGYYLCSWSGDSACGLGHGYFVSWSRNDSYPGCVGSDANGIHRLGATTSGFHTFKIDIQSDGSVQFRRDGSLVYTLGSTSTGCWNRSGDVHAAAYSTAWDHGDQIAGSTGSHESVDAFSVNGGTAATTCDFTSIDSYRCADTGSRDIDLWTIDR